MNENYAQPSLPRGADDDIVKGLHRVVDGSSSASSGARVGCSAPARSCARRSRRRRCCADDWGIDAEVWSATSFSELARDAREAARWNRLHPEAVPRTGHVARCLAGDRSPSSSRPTTCARGRSRSPTTSTRRCTTLGTDGFGRSDTRAALRRFFEVDRHHIALAALTALREQGTVDAAVCAAAVTRYAIDDAAAPSWSR